MEATLAREPLLSVENLSISFGGVVAVDGVTFDLEYGEATCLIGPNGAGKTTIFNLITGELRAHAGSVVVAGRNVTGRPPFIVARHGVCRTFQDVRVFGGMTVFENVMSAFQGHPGERPWLVVTAPRKWRALERKLGSEALTIIEQVGLAARQHVMAGDLSYAEQKLVILGRALAMRSSLWLLDEPSSGLDSSGVQQVMGVIKALTNAGQTVLIVEHNLAVVKDIARRVLFLSEGRVLADGPPDKIFGQAELQSLYFGGRTR
jgi:ABC-type branched-subunit amino acid transport system ATPase component